MCRGRSSWIGTKDRGPRDRYPWRVESETPTGGPGPQNTQEGFPDSMRSHQAGPR